MKSYNVRVIDVTHRQFKTALTELTHKLIDEQCGDKSEAEELKGKAYNFYIDPNGNCKIGFGISMDDISDLRRIAGTYE